MVQNWTNILSSVVEKDAPFIERRVSDKYTPWLNPEIKKMFRMRDKLKTEVIKSRSNILMETYKQVRNRTNATNSKLKKEYFTDKIHSCEGNMKDTIYMQAGLPPSLTKWSPILNMKESLFSMTVMMHGSKIKATPCLTC